MVFRYVWKLDTKHILRAKFHVSSTFDSDFNRGEGVFTRAHESNAHKKLKKKMVKHKFSGLDLRTL